MHPVVQKTNNPGEKSEDNKIRYIQQSPFPKQKDGAMPCPPSTCIILYRF
jgi:hypothetical protein